MNLTCPCCFALISLEVALESASGRELMGVLSGLGPQARPLAAYLGCFRSPSRALSWDRALKLAREVQALDADPRALAAALSDTVESLRAKRVAGDLRPLKNHNYLKQVLTSVPTLPGETLPALAPRRASNAAVYDAVLCGWAGDDKVRHQIMHGLQALLALPLALKPEAASIDRTADLWERQLLRAGLVDTPEELDRLRRAFSGLVSSVKDKFPAPSDVLNYLPARKEQPKLAAVEPAGVVDPELAEKIAAFKRDL